MIHLRVVSPPEQTPEVISALEGNDAVLNLVVMAAASRHPVGDVLQFDVLTGAANAVFALLRERGIVKHGAVVAETVDTWLSDTALVAETKQSRFEALTPVWSSSTPGSETTVSTRRVGTCFSLSQVSSAP